MHFSRWTRQSEETFSMQSAHMYACTWARYNVHSRNALSHRKSAYCCGRGEWRRRRWLFHVHAAALDHLEPHWQWWSVARWDSSGDRGAHSSNLSSYLRAQRWQVVSMRQSIFSNFWLPHVLWLKEGDVLHHRCVLPNSRIKVEAIVKVAIINNINISEWKGDAFGVFMNCQMSPRSTHAFVFFMQCNPPIQREYHCGGRSTMQMNGNGSRAQKCHISDYQ